MGLSIYFPIAIDRSTKKIGLHQDDMKAIYKKRFYANQSDFEASIQKQDYFDWNEVAELDIKEQLLIDCTLPDGTKPVIPFVYECYPKNGLDFTPNIYVALMEIDLVLAITQNHQQRFYTSWKKWNDYDWTSYYDLDYSIANLTGKAVLCKEGTFFITNDVTEKIPLKSYFD